MNYIIYTDSVKPSDYPLLGGKAGALARLNDYSLPIPNWFAVINEAFFDCMGNEKQTLLNIENADVMFDSLTLSSELTNQITAALDCFPAETHFAVRSSAKSEDGTKTSFAGQLESYLWVPKKDVLKHIILVWKSAFSGRIQEYRKNNNIDGVPDVPTVLVQEMVNSEKAGVAFRVNPINADTNVAVISAVFGLGSALVDGEANADVYQYNYRTKETNIQIEKKDVIHTQDKNGTILSKPLDKEKQMEQVLSGDEIRQVALLADKTSSIFGCFQDIEWAFEGGKLFLLQSRPITSIGNVFEETARQIIFDNSNIAESYSGATTPLTFSFIRKAYCGVYEQFCRIFGVSEATISENQQTFRCMLGFADNKVYYNLLSWYKMLSFLPGYSINRSFMEQMMGVKEPLPEHFLNVIHQSNVSKGKWEDGLSLIKSLFKLLANYFALEGHIKKFYQRLAHSLEKKELTRMTVNELYDYYNELEGSLLKKWDAPLENDFFAMIFHGLLKSLCEKWKLPNGIHNDLLRYQGGIISTKPAELIRAIAKSLEEDKEALEILSSGSLSQINSLLQTKESLRTKIQGYIDLYGDRCIDELKLESITLGENPTLLYRSIAASANSKVLNREEEQFKLPKLSFFKRKLFLFVLKNARRLVKNRENLRFERTRLFGQARSIFLNIGVHFASRGIIEQKRDIFYLEIEEILGYINMTATTSDLKQLVALRKSEYEKNKKTNLPGRFVISGVAGSSKRNSLEKQKELAGGALSGIPCCPGIVTGRAQVVTDPNNTDFKDGDILIAKRTDPGWIVLFNLASGIIVEKGSLLSHASIVSREMGIPCIISVENATGLIQSGSILTMDGSTGKIAVEDSNE